MNGLDSTVFILIMSLFITFFSFLIAFIILNTILKKRLIAEKRLRSLYNKQSEKDIILPKKKRQKKAEKNKHKFNETLANELQAAGIMMRVEEFATIWLIASFVPSGLIALLSGNVLLSGMVALAGILAPLMYLKKQKKKRVIAFENQLGDALVTMCNCLRSGLTLGQAFENISTEMSEPISKEFYRVCTEVKYGSTLEKSLNAMSERIDSDDLMLTVTAINIQRQAGGNLSEILSSISETIKARVKLKADVKVATASGKASGIVIGILPLALGFLIFLINPEYMITFVESSIGKILLGIGVVMETLGFLMIKKILTIKY